VSGRLHRALLAPGLFAWLVSTLLGCTGAQPVAAPDGQRAPERTAQTLVIVGKQEPLQLAPVPLRPSRLAHHMDILMFNAGLAYQDNRDSYHPHLAEALPQLNTDTWRVFPDGQMETTYRLRPGLTWHDGMPLTAEDFVFASQVYGGPDFGTAGTPPRSSIQEVVAPDARTVVIRWRRLFAKADALVASGGGDGGPPFPPLPRHILEGPLQGSPEAFLAHPFWSTEYVGPGPFRLERWELGAFFEASAFDGYVFGRPKIDRVRAIFHEDPNTVVAALLAGTAHITAQTAISFDEGALLRREWEARDDGVVAFYAKGGRRTDVQLDPARVNPPALLDVRVRQALAHAIDKEALNQGLFDGLGQTANTWVEPHLEYFPEAERVVAKYPYDLRVAGQRLAEAGYVRGADGTLASPAGERLALQLSYGADPQYDNEAVLIADNLKRVGIDLTIQGLSRAAATPEARATFPALYNNTANQKVDTSYGSAQVPTAQNRYTGNNRSSWQNAEYDRLLDALGKSLDRAERNGYLVRMARLISEELPMIPLYYRTEVIAHVSNLHGVMPGAADASYWNIHTWEFR
jgi:peptide/nickel transport system substrate-binding protein